MKQYSTQKQDPFEMIEELKKQLVELQSQMSESRFSNVDRYIRPQIIAKNGKFKIEEKDSTPSTCEVGELTVVGGELYVCSATDTWTVVGTQS